MRTLGRCDYTCIAADGTRVARYRITEATENGSRYAIYEGSGALVVTGWADIDAMGWTVNGAYRPAGAATVTLQQISATYR